MPRILVLRNDENSSAVGATQTNLWSQRSGKVFGDRYHDRILQTPREVRLALRYVLANGHQHALDGRQVRVRAPVDVFTSGRWFDGWKGFDGWQDPPLGVALEVETRPVAASRTWLLSIGWRRHGLLSPHEMPAAS